MSGSTSITPTFRGEFYFLIAKFLEDGPCKEAAELLRKQVLNPFFIRQLSIYFICCSQIVY